MIFIDKNVGETPLELLDRLRREKLELHDEKLSYAGRLDPMAEGQMLILIGEENKSREKYLGLDKEYIAEFLIGVKTDTGDALGLIENLEKEQSVLLMMQKVAGISRDEIEVQVSKLKNIKEQRYPWFSGRAVDGVKLFDHFKSSNLNIERPIREVTIKKVQLLDFSEHDPDTIEKYIFDSISRVYGDFRQKEILDRWQEFFEGNKFKKDKSDAGEDLNKQKLLTFQIRILVSSGTYIRALTENFDFPTILLKLNRTKIYV